MAKYIKEAAQKTTIGLPEIAVIAVVLLFIFTL